MTVPGQDLVVAGKQSALSLTRLLRDQICAGNLQGVSVQGVTPAVDGALDGVRKAINSMAPTNYLTGLKPNLVDKFTPLDLHILLAGGFEDAINLRDATAEHLLRLGLCGARVFDLKPGDARSWQPALLLAFDCVSYFSNFCFKHALVTHVVCEWGMVV